MPTTRHVVIGNVQITLYSKNGRDWFSSPISLVRTTARRKAELAELKRSWRSDGLIEEIFPAPCESWASGLTR
jgi:hypothetical protein